MISRLAEVFSPAAGPHPVPRPEMRPLRIRTIRDLCRAPGFWAWFFDLWYTRLLTSANWWDCVAHGVASGWREFSRRRQAYRLKDRMRPPIYASAQEAAELRASVQARQTEWR